MLSVDDEPYGLSRTLELLTSTFISCLSCISDSYNSDSGISLHVDPQVDIYTYTDLQLISFFCSTINLPVSYTLGGCEALRDLMEIASLAACTVQVSEVDSIYAFKKLYSCFSQVYDEGSHLPTPSLTLSVTTPHGLEILPEILSLDEARLINTILLDRNSLHYFGLSDVTISKSISIFRETCTHSPHLAICGAIDHKVSNVVSTYAPDYVFTKMFRVRAHPSYPAARLTLDEVITMLLFLESNMLSYILSARDAISNHIRSRREHLHQFLLSSQICNIQRRIIN